MNELSLKNDKLLKLYGFLIVFAPFKAGMGKIVCLF